MIQEYIRRPTIGNVAANTIYSEGRLVAEARGLLFDRLRERGNNWITQGQLDAAKFVLTTMIAEPE